MIDLYVLETCPFCRKVMDFADQNNIKYRKFDVSDIENNNKLIQLGGRDQVPFMVDGEKIMYESDDIIKYLKKEEL